MLLGITSDSVAPPDQKNKLMRNDTTKIEIPLSKRNLAFMLLGAVGFVVAGLFLLLMPTEDGLFADTTAIPRLAGLAGVVFFGFIGYLIGRRFFGRRPGLVIDERGITDHSSGVSVGLVEWADIQEMATTRIVTEPFLVLRTAEPEKYIARAPNALIRRAMQANYRMTGSPLNLSARSLPISFEELVELIQREWERHREEA